MDTAEVKPTEELLTIKTVAEILKIGETKLWGYIRKGRIAHVRLDGSVRISRDAVSDFIKANTVVKGESQ